MQSGQRLRSLPFKTKRSLNSSVPTCGRLLNDKEQLRTQTGYYTWKFCMGNNETPETILFYAYTHPHTQSDRSRTTATPLHSPPKSLTPTCPYRCWADNNRPQRSWGSYLCVCVLRHKIYSQDLCEGERRSGA